MPAGHFGLLTLLLAGSAVALQQQQQDGQKQRYGSPQGGSLLHPNGLKHTTRQPVSHRAPQSSQIQVPPRFKSTDADNQHHNIQISSNNARAIATLAPADGDSAVGAPRSKRPATGPSGGLSAFRARSLQDWEVEDFVLLATVDGKIHARDRKKGLKDKWIFTPSDERPIVDTVYHYPKQNGSDGPDGSDGSDDSDGSTRASEGKVLEDEWLWIVEPTQDGALYVYSSEGNRGIQKLGITVKQLADHLSPYGSDEPAVVYTAEKKSTLFTLNAATGRLIKEFSASSAMAGMLDSCKPVNKFSGLDEEECESNSQISIGRTDYTVAIHNQSSLEPICTIRYSEWTPNNRDRDLQQQYQTTMDNKYIYAGHDGRIVTIDHTNLKNVEDWKAFNRNKLPAPVVRVFDVARHVDEDPKEASLVVLPQPQPNDPIIPPEMESNVFINFTETGGWYAMSEEQYPGVTIWASKAKCYSNNWEDDILPWQEQRQLPRKSELVGIHSLIEYGEGQRQPLLSISAPELSPGKSQPIEIEANGSRYTNVVTIGEPPRSWWISKLQYFAVPLFPLLFAVLGSYLLPPARRASLLSKFNGMGSAQVPDPALPSEVEKPAVPTEVAELPDEPRKVRFTDPEGTAPGEGTAATGVFTAEPPTAGFNEGEAVDTSNTELNGNTEAAKKKKAHRGQRGGRNRKKKKSNDKNNEEQEEGLTSKLGKQFDQDHSMQPDEITVGGGDFAHDLSNTVRLNNLEIRKDKILGFGSGGTTVYEGSFEGRDVAVKQMLPQYFELASQEVSLLQQSDDHPNVIRYFCHQKDPNFLYIAVELCQASLFDLYKDGGNMDGLTSEQIKLVSTINGNVPAALHQLAAGLAHLHSLRIIHRDIKPQNILIAYPKRNHIGGPRFVISDFGLCKTLPDNASTLMGTTGNAGTIGWKAPELIMNPKGSDNGLSSQSQTVDSTSSNEAVAQGVKRAVDIFSLGCVFFYVLTNGAHPFDMDRNEVWTIMREFNIKRNNSNFSKLRDLGDEAEEPMHLVTWMLSPQPEHR